MDVQVGHKKRLTSPEFEIVDKKGKDDQEKSNKDKKYGLVSFQELLDYMKNNEFIPSYYRANWPLKEALFSIFLWHNETLNVWTHLVGFMLFMGLTITNITQVPQALDLLGLFTRFVFLENKE